MYLFGLNAWILLLGALIALYFYLNRKFSYWESRGIRCATRPVVLFGTIWKIFLKPIGEINFDNYKKVGKMHGGYLGHRPVLMVVDPKLINDMNTKDFHVFVDRNDLITGDQLNDRNLFNLKGDEWKKMRSIVSPTFSSGKMRKMHPIIIDCVKRLDENLEKKALNKEMNEIELKKVMSNLTMDVIASCAFGTDIDVYNEEKTNEFIINAQNLFSIVWRQWISFIFCTLFPSIFPKFKLSFFDPLATNFFRSAIKSIITRRQSERVKHKDYLQLILDAKNKTLEKEERDVEDNESQLYGQTESEFVDKTKQNVEISEDDVLATSFIFFLAGYETTGTLLSHVFYSLAVNEKCQEKLYEEVMKFNGDYSYETMAKMSYLEACVAETLRLYTPIPVVGRQTSEEYTLGDTGLTLPKGMLVNFDTYSIHHSPEYYPKPEVWDPERFMPENRDLLTPYTYMPFGLGPRNCVGMRFALMEAKTAIAYLVHKFRFFRTANTTVPLKMKKFAFLIQTDDKYVGIELRNKSK